MERKKEHIENYLKASYETNPLFSCVYLEHNALPSYDFSEIDLSCDFFGKESAEIGRASCRERV